MKLNKKIMKVFFVLSLMIVGLTFANPTVLSAASDTVDFPTFDLFVDGTADLDTSSLKGFALPLPFDDLLSLDVGAVVIPDQKVISESFTVHKLTKISGNTWRIEFTAILNAPLINIWDSTIESSNRNLGLSYSGQDLTVITEDEAQSDRDMGLSFLYGSESTLLENDTDDEFDTWSYATDFDLDTYNILFLEDFNSKSTSNVTITVSYVETTSYTNLNATYAYNKTIYNEFVPQNANIWFRLDLENTNTTFDEYVAHIAITNLDSNGMRSVLKTSANVTDTRYDNFYVGNFDTAITLSSLEARHVRDIVGVPVEIKQTSLGLNSLGLSGWLSDVGIGDILALPAELKDKAIDVTNEARGWDTATALEDAIKEKINAVESGIDSIVDIDNLEILSAIGSWGMSLFTQDTVENAMEAAAEVKDNIADVVSEVKEETFETVLFATNMAAEKIEDVSHKADEAKDATLGFFGAAGEKVGNFGADVKDKISDVAGKVKDGAVSIVSKVKGGLSSTINKIFLILILVIVGIVVIMVVMSKSGSIFITN